MSARHAAVARAAADNRSQDIAAKLSAAAWEAHKYGNGAAFSALNEAAEIALSFTIQPGSEACS